MTQRMSLAPMLSVRRGAEAVNFYRQALGAEVLFRVDDDSGAVVAHLSVHGAEFWIADESPEYMNFSPESLRGSTVRLILTVDAPHAVVADAIRAGAKEISAVSEQNGWLVGRIADPFGHHWEIGKPMSQER